MKSTVTCKHPRLGDEFCVASPYGIRWYRCGALEFEGAAAAAVAAGASSVSSSRRSGDGEMLYEANHCDVAGHANASSLGCGIGCRLMGDASIPSWLLRDAASAPVQADPASSGASTGNNISGGARGVAAVLTASMSSDSTGRLCLVGLDSGAIVAARWSAEDVADQWQHQQSSALGQGAAQKRRSKDGWTPQMTPTTTPPPPAPPTGRYMLDRLTAPTSCHKSMDILVSLTHQRPVVSTFLDTVNPALYALGSDLGSVMLYDVSAGTGNSQRRRSFGQYADDDVLPLISTTMPGRCTALEAVLNSPLIVVASKQLLSSGGNSLGASNTLGAVAAEFSSAAFHRSNSGQLQSLCGSSGALCGSSGGSTSMVDRVRFGATPTMAQPTYTMQLQDLRAPAGSTTIFGISDGGTSTGGAGGCVSSSGTANHTATTVTTTTTTTTRVLLAERIAVHPSQPLIATCGTFRGTSRRHRKRTEVVQLWDVRQPSTPIRVLRATCAPHVSLRWKPTWEPELLGVTTHDIRLWAFSDHILDDEATVTATGFESGTEAGTEEGWLSNCSDQPGDTTGPTTLSSAAASDATCPPTAARASGPRKSRFPSPMLLGGSASATLSGSGVAGGGSATVFDCRLYGGQQNCGHGGTKTSSGATTTLAAPLQAEWIATSQQHRANGAAPATMPPPSPQVSGDGATTRSVVLGAAADDPYLLVVDKQGDVHIGPFYRGVLHTAAPNALLPPNNMAGSPVCDKSDLDARYTTAAGDQQNEAVSRGGGHASSWMLLSSGRTVWVSSSTIRGSKTSAMQRLSSFGASSEDRLFPSSTRIPQSSSGGQPSTTAPATHAGTNKHHGDGFELERRIFGTPCTMLPGAAAAQAELSPPSDVWTTMRERMCCSYASIPCKSNARSGGGDGGDALTASATTTWPQATSQSPSRHPNRFTAERHIALPTLLCRRELPAYYAMRYTLLVRECQEAQTLPVARAPPGLLDLVKGAVGPSAHSQDFFSSCFVTPVGGHYCTWRALDDPLRVFLLKAMAWLPETRVDHPPSESASGRTPPASAAAAFDSLPKQSVVVIPRLSGIDVAGHTQGIAEAVERRVGIALVLGHHEIAVAMLQHYASLDRSYGAIAGMVLGLHASTQHRAPSSLTTPLTTQQLSPPSSATQHTDVLHHCGGYWLRTLLTLSVWRHQRAGVASVLDALDVAQWPDDSVAWLELCQYNLRSGPLLSSIGGGRMLAPTLRQGTGHYDCLALGFTPEQWRTLTCPEFMAVAASERIGAMRRVVQLQEQLFLIAMLLPRNAAELQATQFAAACTDDPLVTALLHGFDASTTTTASASAVADAARALPLYDRVALAAVLLPSNDALYAFLGHMVTEPSVAQSPLAAIFLGFGETGVRHMQGYVDATGDVQLAACLFGPYCRSRSSQNVGAAVWSGWQRSYCAMLNDAELFHERAKHDRAMRVAQQSQSQLEHDARDAATSIGLAATAAASSAAGAMVVSNSSVAFPVKSPQTMTTTQHHHHLHHPQQPHHHHPGGSTAGGVSGGRRAAAAGGGNPHGAAVEVRCSCGQGMHDSAPLKQAPAPQNRTAPGGVQLASVAPAPPAAKPLSLATSCPSDLCVAGAHQALCSVCVHHMGHRGSGLVDGPGMWMVWCTSCLHGGHAEHVAQWFRKHRKCAVDNCACECVDH